MAKAEAERGQKTKKVRWLPPWLAWVGAGVLVMLLAVGAAAEYALRHAEPLLRRRVIATLEERFHSPVELDTLHVSVLRGIDVSGSGLRILNIAGPDEPDAQAQGAAPMLSVKSFSFHSGIRQLLEPTMRVGVVQVEGMQLDIPPKGKRGPLLDNKKRQGQPRIGVLVDTIVCKDMTLTIETDKPGKLPLVFSIRDVTLHDVGRNKPFNYEAWLVNPKPVGDIHATGHFGPWQDDNPRDTPVDGEYSFTNADLGTIKGISGTLSSTGKFGGQLDEIGVTGTTETPDFALDESGHPVELKTAFDATVDGTSGDTRLNQVHATLLHTVLNVSGEVVRIGGVAEGVSGHRIDLSVASDAARIEDLLTLGVKTTPPLMQGGLTLRARLLIPPGPVSVTRKMQVQGTFTIRDAKLSNLKWQDTVNKLSERASGNPEQANAANAARVTSEMSGSFALANAVLKIPALNYTIPGARMDLAGSYGLDGKTFDFDGTVRTQAKASEMLTGWKSIAAMPLDGLLKAKGAGLELPIKISGTESAPKVGVSLGQLSKQVLTRHASQPAPQNASPPGPQK